MINEGLSRTLGCATVDQSGVPLLAGANDK